MKPSDCSAQFQQPINGAEMRAECSRPIHCCAAIRKVLDHEIRAFTFIGLESSAQHCPSRSSFQLFLCVHLQRQKWKDSIFDLFTFSQSRCQYSVWDQTFPFSTSPLDLLQGFVLVFFSCICFYISPKNRWQHSVSKARDCAIKHCGHGGLHRTWRDLYNMHSYACKHC